MKGVMKIIRDHKMLYQLSAYELCNLMLSVNFVEPGEIFRDELLMDKIKPQYLLENLSLKEKKNLTSSIELNFLLIKQFDKNLMIAAKGDDIFDYVCGLAKSRHGLLSYFADIHLLLIIQKFYSNIVFYFDPKDSSWAKLIHKDTVRIILLLILKLKDPFEPNSVALFKYFLLISAEKQLINNDTANEITLAAIKYKSHNDTFLLSIILIQEFKRLLTTDAINQIFLTTTDPIKKSELIKLLNN
jgi:hypothetical protein